MATLRCPNTEAFMHPLQKMDKKVEFWRLGLDFTNVLHTAFTPVAPQSVRTQSSCKYLFMLSGSTSVKAVCRTLMKLSRGLLFQVLPPHTHNILQISALFKAIFTYQLDLFINVYCYHNTDLLSTSSV